MKKLRLSKVKSQVEFKPRSIDRAHVFTLDFVAFEVFNFYEYIGRTIKDILLWKSNTSHFTTAMVWKFMALWQTMLVFPNVSWKCKLEISFSLMTQSYAKANVYTWFLWNANILIIFKSEFLGTGVQCWIFVERKVTYIVNANCRKFESVLWIIYIYSVKENKLVKCLLENDQLKVYHWNDFWCAPMSRGWLPSNENIYSYLLAVGCYTV